jgi:hypothetical protein
MNSLEEIVVTEPVIKQKKARKSKKVAEPVVVESISEPEYLPPLAEEPVLEEPEPIVVCDSCGEVVAPFSDEEMDCYRRVCAFKRKQLRLRKTAATFAEV